MNSKLIVILNFQHYIQSYVNFILTHSYESKNKNLQLLYSYKKRNFVKKSFISKRLYVLFTLLNLASPYIFGIFFNSTFYKKKKLKYISAPKIYIYFSLCEKVRTRQRGVGMESFKKDGHTNILRRKYGHSPRRLNSLIIYP